MDSNKTNPGNEGTTETTSSVLNENGVPKSDVVTITISGTNELIINEEFASLVAICGYQ